MMIGNNRFLLQTSLAVSLLSLGLVLLAFSQAAGQGSQADYERAANLSRSSRGKVFRNRVQPHWLPGQAKFWYRVNTGPGRHRFVFVDAEQGERREMFDHEKLAAALAQQSGLPVEGDCLPIRNIGLIDIESPAILWAFDIWWECDLQTYELRERGKVNVEQSTVNVLDTPRRSRDTGAETEVRFINRTDGEVELYWIDTSGGWRSYGKINPGGKHRQHTYAGHVWLAVDAARRPLAVFEATESTGDAVIDGTARIRSRPRRGRSTRGSAQSPDGKWRAVIKDHNAYLRATDGEEEIQLSDNGTEQDPYVERFAWSPDSKRLVVIQERVGQQREIHLIESSPRDQLQPRLHTFRYDKPGDEMPLARPRLFDVEGGAQVKVSDELFPNAWRISELRWQPDSGRFTFLYNQRGHQVLRIVAVDAETGEAEAIVDEQSDTFVDYANKQFSRYLDATQEIIWMSERDGWNHLYLYDARTGEVKNQITRGSWVVRGVERVDDEQRQIWFRAGGVFPEQDPYYVHYCRVNFDGSDFTVLTAGDGTHSIDFSPDGAYLIDTWSRVDMPPVTELRRTDDGTLVCELERADMRALAESGWPTPERFAAKARDGETDIHGVIYRPTTLDPRRKYPVIEKIYAGPHGSHVPKRFSSHHSAQTMAELGFIVVQIDGMGTSNRSKAFHDVCYKNIADAGFPDRILWMQAAATAHPEMDLSRVGIYGGSAGGQNALGALLAHGDFYKVAVADCGCHDNRMDKIWWNELWMGWPIGSHYELQSNVTNANKLAGKLMLIVGEMDRNVDPASTMQVVDALIKADKDFELVFIPGAGHGAAGTSYGARRQRDFFVRHLHDVEPRWRAGE